jgi:tetratricopeptide (TPR) repeat protein
MVSPRSILLLLLAICFTAATIMQPKVLNWTGSRACSNGLLAAVLGDARQMLGSQFVTQADVYFHSGYYPSFFDEAITKTKSHLAESAGGEHDEEHLHSDEKSNNEDHHHHHDHGEHENCPDHEVDFLANRPHTWIERFSRNFVVAEHTELSGRDAREVLPWLQMAAELNPTNHEVYILGAFVLRQHLHRPNEALTFLREGCAANPDSYEIFYELGRLFCEDLKDDFRAENVWERALKKWEQTEGKKEEPDVTVYRQVLMKLAVSKQKSGDIPAAINYLSRVKALSPNPDAIEKQIQELRSAINQRG